MRRRRLPRDIAAVLTLALAGCSVGPDFVPPQARLPAGWHDASAQAGAAPGPGTVTPRSDPDPRWWREFRDPVLDDLMQRAVAGNLDLQEAVARIAEARLQERVASAAGLPGLTANASYNRELLGLKGLLEANHADALTGQFPQAGGLLSQFGTPIDLFQDGLDASWELDLFGRVRRSVEEAHAQAEATIESRNDALVALEAEVASDYAQLRGAQTNTQIAADDIRIEQGLLDLTRARARDGLTTELDVERASAQLAVTEAQLPQYEQAAARAANELSVLTGTQPGSFEALVASPAPLPDLPSDVPVGLPGSLVRRRPDLRRAEATLHTQTAAIGIAVAQLFPDISLTGEVGTRATQAAFLARWVSLFYAFGPSVSLPLFEGGRLTAGVKLATAEQQEAALDYQKTVLTALEEVENALVAYRTEQQRHARLAQSVAANERALTIARDRYSHGLSSFVDVLTTEASLVETREQLTQSTLTVITDLVTLYKALGGGWEDQETGPGTAPAEPAIGTAGNAGEAAGRVEEEKVPSVLEQGFER